MPVLVDAGRTVVESTILIEHLQKLHHAAPGRRLIPEDAGSALDVRLWGPPARPVRDDADAEMHRRPAAPEGQKDPLGLSRAKDDLPWPTA